MDHVSFSGRQVRIESDCYKVSFLFQKLCLFMNSSDGQFRLLYRLNPLFPMDAWWQVALCVLCLLLLSAGLIWATVRESKQAGKLARFALLSLRLLPVVAIGLFFLNLQRISEQRVVQSSEVCVLLDSSLSMNLRDQSTTAALSLAKQDVGNLPDETASVDVAPETRFQQMLSILQSSRILSQLQVKHEISVYQFDENDQPKLLSRLLRTSGTGKLSIDNANVVESIWLEENADRLRKELLPRWIWVRNLLFVGLALGLLGTFLIVVGSGQLLRGRLTGSTLLSLGTLSFCAGLAAIGGGDLLESTWPLQTKLTSVFQGGDMPMVVATDYFATDEFTEGALWQGEDSELSASRKEASDDSGLSVSKEGSSAELPSLPLSLPKEMGDADEFLQQVSEQVFPSGSETRVGSALSAIAKKYLGGSLAAVILVSDGNDNAGETLDRSLALMRQVKVPVEVIGIGGTQSMQNVALASLEGPSKVFPNNPMEIKGFVRGWAMEGQTVQVKLFAMDIQTGQTTEQMQVQTLTLGPDSIASAFRFELDSGEIGRKQFQVQVDGGAGDSDPSDHTRSIQIEVAQRKSTVLLIAGGPTREFRFLRNQLFRDKMVQLDVWLQSAGPGADQESDQLLQAFPVDLQSLERYDCIVAIDPDWQRLDVAQAKALTQWVAREGGGLVTIAGPVFTPEWSMQPRGDAVIDSIRRLYPVSFFSQGSTRTKIGRFGGREAFALEFTREGTSVDFLSLTNDPLASRQAWNDFAGVYGYYAVNEAKPGAQVFAYFSDPATQMGQQKPIYLAGQFVGNGRVFFQASGEMWRIREVDVEYFQTYYTKLIRWASQGRALRDSSRGVLLVDKQRCWLGDRVTLQAQLRDVQDRPYQSPQIQAMQRQPDGTTKPIVLQAKPDELGSYWTTVNPKAEGQWRFFLPVPDSPDGEVLQALVDVQITDLEKRSTRRNDDLLSQIAQQTGGSWLPIEQLVGDSQWVASTIDQIQSRDLETILPGISDRRFSQRWTGWMFTFLLSYCCLGWFYRRMNRLA